MVICEACGKDVLEGNRFCTSCRAVITHTPIYSGTGVTKGQTRKTRDLLLGVRRSR